ncbi:hypothetical protein OS11_31280 [Dickeya oryzae]
MNFPLIINVLVFAMLLFALGYGGNKSWSLSKKSTVGAGYWRAVWTGITPDLW